jgi:hypothetical protein
MHTPDASKEHQGLRFGSMGLVCVAVVCGLIGLLVAFGADRSQANRIRELLDVDVPEEVTSPLWYYLTGAPLGIGGAALASALGRLIFGLIAGMTPRLTRAPGGNLSGAGGLWYARWNSPEDGRIETRLRTLAWGGPVGVILLVVCSMFWMCVSIAGWAPQWHAELLIAVSTASALWGAIQLWPEAFGSAVSSGWQIAQLDGLSRASRRLGALALLSQQSVKRPDPAHWDTALIVQALEPRDSTTVECEALVVGATHYMAIGEKQGARELLQRAQGLGKAMGYRGTLAVKRMLAALDAAG